MGDTHHAGLDIPAGAFKLGGVAVTATAAELNALHSQGVVAADAAKLHALTASAAELNILDNATCTYHDLNANKEIPFDYTLTPAAGAANVCEVTIQAKDPGGTNIAHVVPLLVWLSDAATGAGLTGHAADALGVKAASGALLNALTANQVLLIQTLANGSAVIQITDTHKSLFKVCVQSLQGETPTIATLIAGNYGA